LVDRRSDGHRSKVFFTEEQNRKIFCFFFQKTCLFFKKEAFFSFGGVLPHGAGPFDSVAALLYMNAC
jgi:hypothetical protein